ncbi:MULTISPECIES: outer membrane lipoprotein carrier protein LolA [Glaesserella]|uniref:Outer membrane lipoprotein carrier protein LolA n=1 Tax=Glaesserella australis TaxID=2094024 RepID=A0A328BWJ0_9PAST|nr:MULTISPECIES: outer membrane lipoprotein carrier protein LolA [Glaesserella]AUI66514.1 hypothetical protein CJD39_07965 [Glaesserella sp. 15-184]RAL18688.1 outer membrane lipoprotein carrier protein LolA [Glaesserella australis]
MKKFLFLILTLFSVQVLAFSQQDLITQLQKPNRFQGDFTQQRYLKAMSKPITSTGKFVLIKNQGLLWHMQKPFTSQLRVKKEGISQWNGSQWVESQKLGQSQQISLFLGLLSGDISALSSQFDLAISGNAKDWQLTLTPSSLLMKQIFNQIVIGGDEMVKRIELNETQGDRTLIQFENTQQNQPLSDNVRQALQ